MGSNPDRPFTYTNLARDAYKGDLLGLFEAGEAVESLLAHPGWAHIVRLVGLDVAGLDARLERLLDSRAEYAHLTGRRSGLRSFEEAAHAIVTHAKKTLAEQDRKHNGAAEPVSMGA